MPNSGWSESAVLAEWADKECRHLDLIASWEILLSAYDVLGFGDEITDEQRLTEFKSVVGELNKFLTRMRNGLMRTKDIDDAIAFLTQHANTADMNNVKGRPSVAYNKLKQRWIGQSISILAATRPQAEAEEGERADD
jgi:hypothetical protein